MEDTTLSNTKQALEKQLAALRAQVADLTNDISSMTADAAEAARPRLKAARGAARHGVETIRSQGSDVMETVRENPGTATSIAVTAGLLGLAIGYLAASNGHQQPSPSRWRF